jgi:uncharacterized repeat protein (TIGR01451 family)
VQGGFDGSTYGGYGGADVDRDIICGTSSGATCDIDPVVDKSGVTLYPVDSEFGYYVVDFLGAVQKARDGDYLEGFVGNIPGGGIMVSNAATDTYKVKPPLGTWCRGLGGNSVKCETEHYTTMEHVLSCHEVIPYFFSLPDLSTQAILSFPPEAEDSRTFDCSAAGLDDVAYLISGGDLTMERLVNATPCEAENDPEGCQMFPNDKTDMSNNVALSTDYSVQLKDDGKPLYGWGAMHKRPNDIRMYAKLDLPAEWKVPGANFTVNRANLIVEHWITNNPNDQLRPEDLENEAATGRKPSYKIEGTPGTDTEVWKSTVPCYEGDADTIDTEDGYLDPTFIGVGTVLRNMPYALDPAAEPGLERADDPYALSSDLRGAFTNAYYTSTNRDPFEWSYRPLDSAADTFEFIGCAGPVDDPAYAGTCEDDYDIPYTDVGNLGLVSGPRWRLKPNKFGQDLPGLEIPLAECSPPPFEKENIKYNVGVPTTTVINLLDWDEEANGPSPLATSRGWVDVTSNNFVEVAGVNGKGVSYTTNGLPMTKDFNLAVYIKGDRKAVAVYNARLEIDYGPISTTDYDLEVTDLTVPATVNRGDDAEWSVTVRNNGPADATAVTLTVEGVTDRNWSYGPWTPTFNLAAGASRTFTRSWRTNIPDTYTLTIDWEATIDGAGDTNPANDTMTATTILN